MEHFLKKKDGRFVVNKVLCLESSHGACNGRVLSVDYFGKVRKIANQYDFNMHLDGARSLNAAAYLGITPAQMTKDFDTISVCLSKGLGNPACSVLLGPKKLMERALITRKLLGGGMRQAGIYARAGLESLTNWREKLEEDHENA